MLQTYGHGNWPTALSSMMQMLRRACDGGIIVVNTTQCSRGSVLPIYAVGRELQEVGVVAGHDMTVEAALMKLSYILGKDEWSLREKREVCRCCARPLYVVIYRLVHKHREIAVLDLGPMYATDRQTESIIA